jgi:hypothetical protein
VKGRINRCLEYLQKEFASWGVKTLFSLALAMIVSVLKDLDWFRGTILAISVGVLVFTGAWIVQEMVNRAKVEQLARANAYTEQENRRWRRVRKLIKDLVSEGEGLGIGATDGQVDSWLAKVECTIHPIFHLNDFSSFMTQVNKPNAQSYQKRERAIAYLKAWPLRYKA